MRLLGEEYVCLTFSSDRKENNFCAVYMNKTIYKKNCFNAIGGGVGMGGGGKNMKHNTPTATHPASSSVLIPLA